MRVSREQVLENKRTILEAAGRLFRERGFESVTVADVMKSAGLTHGGFYGYFKSKDDLIAQALAEVLGRAAAPPADLADYAARYLSRGHRDNVAGGCPVAALAARSGLSERGFLKRFRAATGMAPMEYVQVLRIEEAKHVLETTERSVDEVAADVGYVEPASFRRLFRRMVGLAPSEYRRRNLLPQV